MVLVISIRGIATNHRAVAGCITASLLWVKWITAIATGQPKKVLPASPIKTLVLDKGFTVRVNGRKTQIEVVL